MRPDAARLSAPAALPLALLASVALAACADPGPKDSDTAPDTVPAITVTPVLDGVDDPLDATPGPDGVTVYYAGTEGGVSGVWQIDRSDPLARLDAPRGLVFEGDGATIYASAAGGLYAIPAAGGDPALIPGTEGMAVDGVDTAEVDGAGCVFFVAGGQAPGLYRVAEAGGAVEAGATGAPFATPGGVVVGEDGTAWVVDRSAGLGASGALIRVSGGAAEIVVDSFIAGDPAGVALTPDGAAIMISSLDDAWRPQVLIVSAADASTSVFNDVIGENDTSGGLHRADVTADYAWVDRRGTIYYIEL